MSLGKRLLGIENVQRIFVEGRVGYSLFQLHLINGQRENAVYFREYDAFVNCDLQFDLMRETEVGNSTLIILSASIIEGLDLIYVHEESYNPPTFKIHYAALHKNLLAIHALYYGRIYTYDEKADAFHTWHLEQLERGWSLLTMSEAINPDWIVLDECDCMSRHLPGVYKIARFTDACWWKGSAYEAKDQRRQDQHKATYYKQQQREANEKAEKAYATGTQGYGSVKWDFEEGIPWRKEGSTESHQAQFEEWFNNQFKQRVHQKTYAPPTLDDKPGSLLWAYSTLGLERGQCSFDDVKRARKELMKRYHPDATNGDSDLDKAQEINWAADVLERVLA